MTLNSSEHAKKLRNETMQHTHNHKKKKRKFDSHATFHARIASSKKKKEERRNESFCVFLCVNHIKEKSSHRKKN